MNLAFCTAYKRKLLFEKVVTTVGSPTVCGLVVVSGLGQSGKFVRLGFWTAGSYGEPGDGS